MEYRQNQQQLSDMVAKKLWQKDRFLQKPKATSTPIKMQPTKAKNNVSSRNAKDLVWEMKKNALVPALERDSFFNTNHSKELDNLRLEASNLRARNEQLTDEKLRLSSQLGLQTQVSVVHHI